MFNVAFLAARGVPNNASPEGQIISAIIILAVILIYYLVKKSGNSK
jgi:hypothetical protein